MSYSPSTTVSLKLFHFSKPNCHILKEQTQFESNSLSCKAEMTETCGKLLFFKKMWLTVSQCGNALLCGSFLEMKSEKRNWWKKRSSTAVAWWIPFRQRKHILCKRNSIYRHLEVLRSVVLLSVSCIIYMCTYCLSDLNLCTLNQWNNENVLFHECGSWIWRRHCDVTHPVILSGCTVHNNRFFKDKVCFRQG